jgi:ribosomal protein S18 acetylase RimI-like enzyme
MLAAWPAVERERLGAWTLRFAGGFTGRANSVLPHGDPGSALEQAVVRCEQAYGARGLPARFQLREGHELAGLEQVLAQRHYLDDNQALVLAGPLPAAAPAPEVSHADLPSEDWLDTWRAVSRRPSAAQEPHARALLARVSQPRTFSLLHDGGGPIATALGTLSPGWLGLSCLGVREDARRHGAAGRLLGALAAWGRARGAEGLWLEVERENQLAIAWYRRLGLRQAGAYRYRTAPSIARTAS